MKGIRQFRRRKIMFMYLNKFTKFSQYPTNNHREIISSQKAM